MLRSLRRRVERSEALCRRKAAANEIPIICATREDVPARVDVLIADGKIAEADRWRCIWWHDHADPDTMTHDERVTMREHNETEADKQRALDESAEQSRARCMADPILRAAVEAEEARDRARRGES